MHKLNDRRGITPRRGIAPLGASSNAVGCWVCALLRHALTVGHLAGKSKARGITAALRMGNKICPSGNITNTTRKLKRLQPFSAPAITP
jgi:hypothetical protein